MSQIITAPSIEMPKFTSVFLAGGIVNCKEWQKGVIMDKVKIKVSYMESDITLICKYKEFPGYSDFTMWACEESNRLKDGLKIIGMTVVIGND